jgi:hypothetical protein
MQRHGAKLPSLQPRLAALAQRIGAAANATAPDGPARAAFVALVAERRSRADLKRNAPQQRGKFVGKDSRVAKPV